MPPSRPVPHDKAADGVPPRRHEPFRTGGATRLRVRSGTGHGPSSVLRLLLDGELDADTAATLRDDLAVLSARSAVASLVLDLSGVTFCDLASLYTLRGICRTLPLAGVDVRLVEPSAAVRTAARRAGLATDLDVDRGGEEPPPAAPP
ncbi:STAS domain-containing protein [Streptomyces sp. MA15]|uniref:STAS domain-containing protein n=1 Tax=Streptomyces sp. MA15 TaxID=3055061 RepID=UPI0025B0232D|nr:STAS domain-containing protein [Streptomyces sp. MA15]MDN3270423.1 STAS domain-containing protein [Streptomyces sp. MA15]